MQAYGRDFAYVYNSRWSGFANQVAPLILDFYASKVTGRANKSLLDLCCGAGHLAVYFLENGYEVVGIDLSEHMLHYAKENASRFIESGQGNFMKADASDFTLDKHFGLVVCTYDSINHLENERALISCLQCVYSVSEGYFIFDLNTRCGLKRWNSIQVDESSEEFLVITRGIYDGQSDRAWMRMTGFAAMPDGLYRRFDETVYNTVFSTERVRDALLEVGWKNVYFARIQDLSTPLLEPEEEGRVFIVANK
jgi:SAM-dependent methyltransferase